MKKITPSAFHVMLKPRGAICNLDCRYCYYLSKEQLYPGSGFCMSNEMLETFTRQYIEAQQVPQVTFAWQGGEPTLMGLDFFRHAVALQERYRKPGMTILNALQTNATTLNDEWCEFFREHRFLVGVSLDGPRELHDAYRVDKGGAPTFDRVMAGIHLLQQHQVEFNILSCIHAANASHGRAVYRFLRDDIGTRFIQFIPVVERDETAEGIRISPRTVSGKDYGRFLIAVFDEWLRRDVGRVFVQIFDVALAAWMGSRPGLCVFEETCGLALAMEHNGDVYSCDHYVSPTYRLGNINKEHLIELVDNPRQREFGNAKQNLPRYCRACEVRFVCNGGCPKDRVLETPDGEPGLNYLCEGYRAFFNHVDTPMKVMQTLIQRGLAPAAIMELLPHGAA